MLMKLWFCFGICLPLNWFFLILTFGLIIAQQTSFCIKCFMAGGWHTSCHPISKMHIVGEEPGEMPSALRCLSYLINSFLTDIEQLAITRKTREHSLSPFWCFCQKHLCHCSYLNKTATQKLFSDQPWSLILKLNLLWRSWVWHCSL